MKKLITARIVEEFAASHETTFFIDDNTLVTPSAKDAARTLHIAFVNECEASKAQTQANTPECGLSQASSDCKAENTVTSQCNPEDITFIVEAVMKILNEMGLLDKLLEK